MSKHFSHLCLLMPLILISFEGFCESSCIPQDKDCLFYVNCLEKSQSCGSKGYALSYGLPYCQKFKEEVRFSEKAQVWRDRVLICLQQSLVKFMDKNHPQSSCSDIKQQAFKSHVACYTQSPHSICDFHRSPDDIQVLLTTIKMSDLLSEEGSEQVKAVAKTCIKQLAGQKSRLPEAVILRSQKFWQEVIDSSLYNSKVCY